MTSHPPKLTSPSRPGAASVATWSAHGSTQSFRSQFSKDLSSYVLYECEGVINRLTANSGLSDVSSNVDAIRGIAQQLRSDCAKAFKVLHNVANKILVDESDKKRTEAFMYEPLTEIFDAIDQARSKMNPPRGRFRQFICSDTTPLVAHDPVHPKAFQIKPDFPVAELPPPESPNDPFLRNDVSQVLWRQCPSFLEVKATAESKNSPVPSSLGNQSSAKPTLTQCADYARAILSARPFQVFVFGIILCGETFWVALFDRRGVALSPSHSILDDKGLCVFIRVVLRITWEMSTHDLGQDPSSRLLEGYTFYGNKYPRFAVGMGGTLDTRRWRTIGEPLWTSHSLLGRGTSVWRVVGGDNQPAILKVAWRTENRRAEAEIYDEIMKLLGGTAVPGMVTCGPTFVWGGDVRFPGESGAPVSVYSLRGLELGLRHSSVDVRLHRVAFPDFGKPLWKYTNPEQLVRAMKVALEGHQTLCKHGVLHRDISAGNILIRMKATYKDGEIVQSELDLAATEGFLTDFELAALPHAKVKEHVVPINHDPASDTDGVVRTIPTEGTALEQSRRDAPQKSKVKFETITVSDPKTAGDGMTGTAMFMASELLYAIKHNKSISRTVAHDVESFAWVFIYVVYKHAVDEPDESGRMDKSFREALRKDFEGLFSGVSVGTLYDNRALRLRAPEGPDNLVKYASECIQDNGKLSGLVQWAWTILEDLLPARNSAPTQNDFYKELAEKIGREIGTSKVKLELTHPEFLLVLQTYIKRL